MSDRYSHANLNATIGLLLCNRSIFSTFGPNITPIVCVVPSILCGRIDTVLLTVVDPPLAVADDLMDVSDDISSSPLGIPVSVRSNWKLMDSPTGVIRIVEMTSVTCFCPAVTEVFCEPICTG